MGTAKWNEQIRETFLDRTDGPLPSSTGTVDQRRRCPICHTRFDSSQLGRHIAVQHQLERPRAWYGRTRLHGVQRIHGRFNPELFLLSGVTSASIDEITFQDDDLNRVGAWLEQHYGQESAGGVVQLELRADRAADGATALSRITLHIAQPSDDELDQIDVAFMQALGTLETAPFADLPQLSWDARGYLGAAKDAVIGLRLRGEDASANDSRSHLARACGVLADHRVRIPAAAVLGLEAFFTNDFSPTGTSSGLPSLDRARGWFASRAGRSAAEDRTIYQAAGDEPEFGHDGVQLDATTSAILDAIAAIDNPNSAVTLRDAVERLRSIGMPAREDQVKIDVVLAEIASRGLLSDLDVDLSQLELDPRFSAWCRQLQLGVG